jgi:hypothetical protein
MGVIPFSPVRRNLRLRLEALLVTMHRLALTMDANARHIEKAVALQARTRRANRLSGDGAGGEGRRAGAPPLGPRSVPPA